MDRMKKTGRTKTAEGSGADENEIMAIPALVRVPRAPGHRKIIGMLTNTAKVVDKKDLRDRNTYHNQGTVWHRMPAP
jgi:hypothetical protein